MDAETVYALVIVGGGNPMVHAFPESGDNVGRPVCGVTIRRNARMHLYTVMPRMLTGAANCAGCVAIVGEQ